MPSLTTFLYRVLDNARFAPSGGNRQGWRIIVVKDDAKRKAIRDLYIEPWRVYASEREHLIRNERVRKAFNAANDMAENLHTAPVHLVVCVELAALSLTDAALGRPTIVGGGSVYTLVQNILLACRAEGLGAALTTLLCVKEPEAFELLGVPPEYAMAALLPVGYPEKGFPKKLTRMSVEQLAFVDSFDGAPLKAS